MNFFHDIVDHTHRLAVDVLSSHSIDKDSPWSPEVPEDLREWLPDLFDRFPIVLPWTQPSPVDPALHTVWLLDNTAFRTPAKGDHRPELAEQRDPNYTRPTVKDDAGRDVAAHEGRASGWEMEIVACYFVKNSGRDVARVAAQLAHALDIEENDVACRKRIEARLQPFLDTVLPNRTLRINVADAENLALGPSSHSGISSSLHPLHFNPPVDVVSLSSSALTIPPPFSLPSTTFLAPEKGWMIISDIDDTIKITQSPSPLGLLRNTFTVPTPLPTPDMPDLYARLQQVLGPSPPFFYLSASPYPLYPFLRTFLQANYPAGTLILRDASWQNLGGFVASLSQDVEAYKLDRISKIHSWLPHRQTICIGDSTQSDPEAYGDAARKYPGWIKAIFIRRVEGIAGMDESKKNADGRFEAAFKGLDRSLWTVFSDPREVAERVEALIAQDGGRERVQGDVLH